jgi:hypothetical protein
MSWPAIASLCIRIVRFRKPYLEYGVERRMTSRVAVPIYSVAKALADAFRNPKLVDRSVATASLRSAITQRKASPPEIAQAAVDCGAWKVIRPYLEAMTHNG